MKQGKCVLLKHEIRLLPFEHKPAWLAPWQLCFPSGCDECLKVTFSQLGIAPCNSLDMSKAFPILDDSLQLSACPRAPGGPSLEYPPAVIGAPRQPQAIPFGGSPIQSTESTQYWGYVNQTFTFIFRDDSDTIPLPPDYRAHVSHYEQGAYGELTDLPSMC